MARTLDSPVPATFYTQVTGDALRIELRRNPDMSVNTTMSGLTSVIHLRDDDGKIVQAMTDFIPVAQWPEEMKDMILALREYLKALYELDGKLPPGDDTVDIE